MSCRRITLNYHTLTIIQYIGDHDKPHDYTLISITFPEEKKVRKNVNSEGINHRHLISYQRNRTHRKMLNSITISDGHAQICNNSIHFISSSSTANLATMTHSIPSSNTGVISKNEPLFKHFVRK